MAYQIVPIEEQHIKGFNAALGVIAREKKYISFTKTPSLISTRKFVIDNIQKGNPQFVLVVDGKVGGWCDIIPKEKDVDRHVGRMGVGLLPEYRGKGIGGKLIKKTLKKAKEKGLKRIELGVRADNRNALGLYLKLGFEIEGLQKKAHYIDGKYIDVYMMALFI